jgi:hypothetical protein
VPPSCRGRAADQLPPGPTWGRKVLTVRLRWLTRWRPAARGGSGPPPGTGEPGRGRGSAPAQELDAEDGSTRSVSRSWRRSWERAFGRRGRRLGRRGAQTASQPDQRGDRRDAGAQHARLPLRPARQLLSRPCGRETLRTRPD